MLKRFMAALLTVFCLAALPLAALAAESLRVTVAVPYFQIWKTDVPDADDRFTYRWTAEEDAPVPEGITTSYWDWDLAGNTEGKLPMVFQFEEPGTYQYRLAAFVPDKKPGYVYETRTYLLVVLVQNAQGGGLQADWYILNEDSGEKVDVVELDPSYTARRDDESGSTPEEPSDDSSGTGKVDGEDAGSGKDGSSDGGSDSGQAGSSGNGSTGSGSTGSGAGSGQGSSAGGSSGSGKNDESGTGIGIGKVRTGDDTVIRSWAAILSVSGLMILYLVCREVGERREKKKDGRKA